MKFQDRISPLLTLLAAGQHAFAALNGACSTGGSQYGVCLHTADCGRGGGTSTKGFCPNDPDDVRCCTKPSCATDGDCRFTNQCDGTKKPGLCPGPTDFQCCIKSSGGGAGGGSPGGGSGGSTSTSHTLSDAGAAFIADFEGFVDHFYTDAAGVKTIGYGHACQPASECDSINSPITEAEGQRLLQSDAKTFVDCINKDVTVPLNQNQFDALVSFTYNLGCGNLADIAVYLNRNEFTAATTHMKEYTHAGGVELAGLVTRRNKEVDYFNKK